MSEKKSKNIVIIALCITLIFMGVGFAALSQTLTVNATATINGSWDVHYSEFKDNTSALNLTNNEGVSTNPTGTTNAFTTDTTAATVAFTLKKPGDKVQYTATIINAGSIQANLDSFTSTLNNDPYIVRTVEIKKTGASSYTTITNGGTMPTLQLATNETAEVLITYEFNSSLTDLPDYTGTDADSSIDTNSDNVKDAYQVTDTLTFTFAQSSIS